MLNTFVGGLVDCKDCNGEATQDTIAAKHTLYVEALQDLFESHKESVGFKDWKLRLV